MAWTEVGSGTQRATATHNNATSGTLAFPGSVTSGSLLVVAGANWQATLPSTISVTDTLSTSYSVVQVDNASYSGFIAYGVASSGGANTVTVDPTQTGNYFSFSIDEFSGPHATPLDVDGGSSSGNSTAPLDAITTSTANDLIIGLMFHIDSVSDTLSPGSGYTQIGEQENNSTSQCHNAEFKIVTTATSYNVDWSTGSSRQWVAMTMAFKPSIASPKGLIMLLGNGGFL